MLRIAGMIVPNVVLMIAVLTLTSGCSGGGATPFRQDPLHNAFGFTH